LCEKLELVYVYYVVSFLHVVSASLTYTVKRVIFAAS